MTSPHRLHRGAGVVCLMDARSALRRAAILRFLSRRCMALHAPHVRWMSGLPFVRIRLPQILQLPLALRAVRVPVIMNNSLARRTYYRPL